ncbi:Xaa-Pro peptidase family protein [Neobacillus niacini]|uniref:M24 family metallopeptidase n=1 Tax=Neobacillus niacini TaxID=86668 RepID=UPI0007AB98B5|nr:Xaa-Pro peptidase family protein [Neobacillus niacini]MEC1522707.1 Xaa-Pro peptidase family protein [Neobacillus niacini]
MQNLTQLRDQFDELGVNALLITNGRNRRYLTGFTGSAGVAVITKTEAALFVDFRYVEQANSQVEDFSVIQICGTVYEEISKMLDRLGVTLLGFEAEDVTYQIFSQYKEKVKAEMVPLTGVIEMLRMIKTKEEIEKIKTAAKIADSAFTRILDFIRPGVTEIEVANELEFYMRKLGATSSAYDIIVASGQRSALPHGVASTKLIETGDMVTLDFGAYYQGYRSDMTRTIAVGEPRAELKEIYNIVFEALSNALAAIKPGITGQEADAFTRDYITEKGYGEQYGHGSGHGIGLDIHEEPFMSPKCNIFLKPGMIVTVEPGIYIPDLGGVRIEDDILITEYGNKIITKSPKELIIL